MDDEPGVLDLLAANLKPLGAQVLDAPNGKLALEILRSRAVSLIITDFRMPEMDGIDFILALQQEGFTEVPVILLTGVPSPELREEALDLGCFAFLEKPVDFDGLAELARKALSAHAEKK